MKSRQARFLSVGALVLTLASASFAAAFQQGDVPPPERVKNFAAATREVLRVGGTTTPVLATLAKSESTATATLVNWIGQSIKDKAAPEGLDTAPAAVDAQVKALVAAARDLLGLRERALEPLAAAIGDAGNGDVKPYLEKAESRVYVALCSSAIRSYIGPNNQSNGTFDGMFANLEKFNRDKVGDAFMDLLASKGQSATVRNLAGEGLAQLGSKRHIEPLKALLADPDPAHKPFQLRIVYTLARLGDRTLIDKHLARIASEMEKLKKPDMTPQETRAWAQGYHQSAVIAQTIHDTDAAIKYYLQFLEAIDPIKDKIGPQDNQTTYYNLACLHSLKGEIDPAFQWLEKAFVAGYTNFKWANLDGDLMNLRKDPRYKAMVDKWESGKGGAESAPASKPT
jgi:tetratricopeptide (TPR) repeat protein